MRTLFAPDQDHLTGRDRDAATFHGLADGEVRRELPEVEPLPVEAPPEPVVHSDVSLTELDSFETALIESTLMAGRVLDQVDAGVPIGEAMERAEAVPLREQFTDDRALFDRLDQVMARVTSNA